MITLGLVDSVDDNGVYVTMPGSRGLLRGPFQTLQNVAAGDRVLVVTTDDGEAVIVGLASPIGTGGFPATSTDNAVARFDGTGGALQDSGVTIDDNGGILPTRVYVDAPGTAEADVFFRSGTSARWKLYKDGYGEGGSNAGSDLWLQSRADNGSLIGTVLVITRATGRIGLRAVGATAGLEFGASGPRDMAGSGSPEGVVSAPVGSTWRRTNGGSGTTFYVKESGGYGNTGWVGK